MPIHMSVRDVKLVMNPGTITLGDDAARLAVARYASPVTEITIMDRGAKILTFFENGDDTMTGARLIGRGQALPEGFTWVDPASIGRLTLRGSANVEGAAKPAVIEHFGSSGGVTRISGSPGGTLQIGGNYQRIIGNGNVVIGGGGGSVQVVNGNGNVVIGGGGGDVRIVRGASNTPPTGLRSWI